MNDFLLWSVNWTICVSLNMYQLNKKIKLFIYLISAILHQLKVIQDPKPLSCIFIWFGRGSDILPYIQRKTRISLLIYHYIFNQILLMCCFYLSKSGLVLVIPFIIQYIEPRKIPFHLVCRFKTAWRVKKHCFNL